MNFPRHLGEGNSIVIVFVINRNEGLAHRIAAGIVGYLNSAGQITGYDLDLLDGVAIPVSQLTEASAAFVVRKEPENDLLLIGLDCIQR